MTPRPPKESKGPITIVSDHAVERFIERHVPGWQHTSAKWLLERISERAIYQEHEDQHQEIWKGPRGLFQDLVLIVCDGTLRTVLPQSRGGRPLGT